MSDLYIGLMSGTSIDAVDVVVVDFSSQVDCLAQYEHPIPDALRQRILNVCEKAEINTYGELDCELGLFFAEAINICLDRHNIARRDIKAIGSHGQTVRHQPNSIFPFSLQIGDPNLISEKTQITTITDFRRRDIACQGQGAPLVPAFHAEYFAVGDVVLNIGGMANVTIINDDVVKGFDTGPGNVLMDAWASHCNGQRMDKEGVFARSGKIIPRLLQDLLNTPYLQLPPPKSTGREQFNLEGLQRILPSKPNKEDVQRTLIEFTAITISQDINQYAPHCQHVYVCGGGVYNTFLMQLLGEKLTVPLSSTTVKGIDPQWLEAIAFGWLARRTLAHLPGNLPAVTGASKSVILGAVYSA